MNHHESSEHYNKSKAEEPISEGERLFIEKLKTITTIPGESTTFTVYCDGSSKPQLGPGGFGLWGTDTAGYTYNMWGFVGDVVTNNRAELYAYICLLNAALYFKWGVIEGHFDSRYVMDGAIDGITRWKSNGWKNSTGDIVANLQEWRRIDYLQRQIQQNDQLLKHTWVKAHNGTNGNEMADINADKGRLAGSRGHKEPVIMVEPTVSEPEIDQIDAPEVDIEVEDKKPAGKNVPLCTKLLSGKRLIFCTNQSYQTNDSYHIYYTTTFDDTLDDEGKHLGSLSSDCMYGVVLSKDPIPQIDAIVRYQNQITPDDFQQPVLGLLPRIQKKDNWNMLTTYGHLHLINERLNVHTVHHEPLTIYVKPPRRGYEALKHLGVLLDRLDHYRLGILQSQVLYTDITDSVYTKQKSKWALAPSIQAKDKAIGVPIRHNEKELSLALTFGVNVPSRNDLSTLAKQSHNLQVILIRYEMRSESFRYSVIIQSDDNFGIFVSPLANIRVIPK